MRVFLERGSPPTVAETAEALGLAEKDVAEAYRELERNRAIVLAPGTLDVWMANPLSAVPTPFRVSAAGRSYYGNCVWDGLGVLAMLGSDGRVETWCPDCGEPIVLEVEDGEIREAEAIAHFSVPAARWWENIAFT